MAEEKGGFNQLDKILKNTIDVINNSKKEIFDIAENARSECKYLENELTELKNKVKETINTVAKLEIELKESKRKLMLLSKNHDKHSEDKIKKAYDEADNLRINLAVKRELEKHYIQQRNKLESRIKHAYKSVEKAESLISNVGVALGYLTGDLLKMTSKLEDMQNKQLFGIRIIQAQEEERKRVARDVHDGPAQSMSNVVLKAEICEKLIDIDIENAKKELKNLKQIVRSSLKDVRKIIYDLRPMSLDDLGLVPTLQRYLTTFKDDHNIETFFRSIGEPFDLKPMVSLTAFRIVQEALNNVVKYAKASNVSVKIEFLDKTMVIVICDDGIGFNIEEVKQRKKNMSSGFGLASMKERLELLDGEFELDSGEKKGTKIKVSIPLDCEEEIPNE